MIHRRVENLLADRAGGFEPSKRLPVEHTEAGGVEKWGQTGGVEPNLGRRGWASFTHFCPWIVRPGRNLLTLFRTWADCFTQFRTWGDSLIHRGTWTDRCAQFRTGADSFAEVRDRPLDLRLTPQRSRLSSLRRSWGSGSRRRNRLGLALIGPLEGLFAAPFREHPVDGVAVGLALWRASSHRQPAWVVARVDFLRLQRDQFGHITLGTLQTLRLRSLVALERDEACGVKRCHYGFTHLTPSMRMTVPGGAVSMSAWDCGTSGLSAVPMPPVMTSGAPPRCRRHACTSAPTSSP